MEREGEKKADRHCILTLQNSFKKLWVWTANEQTTWTHRHTTECQHGGPHWPWLLSGLPSSTPPALQSVPSKAARVNLTDCRPGRVSPLCNFRWFFILFRVKANNILMVYKALCGGFFWPPFKNSLTSSPIAVLKLTGLLPSLKHPPEAPGTELCTA